MSARALVTGVVSIACSWALAGCSADDRTTPVPTLIVGPGIGGGAAGASGITIKPGPIAPLLGGATVSAEHVAPVVGGTLLVTRSGSTIVAADPDRDAVFLVDAASHAVRTVTLDRGDEPGRIAEGADGTLYVALRRAGAVVAIDAAKAEVVSRVAVCASPRGLAFDAKKSSLYVACRSGLLLTLSSVDLTRTRSLQLDSDLRDVLVRTNDLVVTRFLSSEIMVVADDGSVSRRATPDPQPGCGEATVAFKALALSTGEVAVGHQASSDETVSASSGGYGFSCGGGLVSRFLSMVDVDHPTTSIASPPTVVSQDPTGQAPASAMTFTSLNLPGAGPLDFALDEQHGRAAAIALDDSLDRTASFNGTDPSQPQATLWVSTWDGKGVPPLSLLEDKGQSLTSVAVPGQPVAVAFDAAGKYVVQSREPATLELEGGIHVALSSESHADTGQTMFYMNSGIGISCSSCHPEGGEDGHVWRFNEGLRRTMPLEGGVLERAPFHWDGSLGDMNALVGEVMVKRMAMGALPSDGQIAALGSFLEQLPALPGPEGLDAAAIARGSALFRRDDVACATCHGGPQYTNNSLADVGTGGTFATPSLLGVGLRTALFHDGCAKNISQRFGVCGGTAHGKPELLSAAERADLVEFLRSL